MEMSFLAVPGAHYTFLSPVPPRFSEPWLMAMMLGASTIGGWAKGGERDQGVGGDN